MPLLSQNSRLFKDVPFAAIQFTPFSITNLPNIYIHLIFFDVPILYHILECVKYKNFLKLHCQSGEEHRFISLLYMHIINLISSFRNYLHILYIRHTAHHLTDIFCIYFFIIIERKQYLNVLQTSFCKRQIITIIYNCLRNSRF